MKNLICIAALSSLLAFSAHAKTLTIGLDLSDSNPLLKNEAFALNAGKHAAKMILDLKHGDVVRVKSFGARDSSLSQQNYVFKISNRMRVQKVSKVVAHYISTIPSQAKLSQSSTNIVAFLEFDSGFNCQDSSSILLITDGLESSSYLHSNQLISGKKSLPSPEVNLQSCSVTFYGLGADLPPISVKRVKSEWQNFIESAGASFTPYFF